MRLFVGVEVGERVAAAASRLIEQLQKKAATLAPRAKIAWVPAGRLHVTLRFIGHVDDEQHRALARALAPRLPVRPFDLEFAGPGTFPESGPPRVIWAGVSAGHDSLQALEREVTARLEATGVPPEDRAYRPHLTLARVREAAGLKAAALIEGFRDRELGAARVEAITLFESRLSPKGPTYVALQHTQLGR